ncbi:LysR family transcriptional regulator [Bordetella bronchialis]|uniref:LysR family transcriptional regulator n=1 Tax=Bordetella bronchialis TaxID=463025 RepID=A0A193G480_9BORD|nr:LysR family transcriptional regulator [Bordetella bronchialis]ANN68871.1 LysR family transcriptional regulator [Bordetella bronchialis]ANN74019.1 LysR family transcriptional regulator [Bordetella bronchialis]
MDIQLNDIALFVEVAKRKNFSHAAEALGIPSATLSKRVTELERRIGMQLLTRTTRRIELTEAGALYFDRCRHIIEEARVAHEQLQDMAALPRGRLRVSMGPSLAALVLPVVMREFTDQYPDIECEFDVTERRLDPISNPFDLVLRLGPQPDSSLISRKLMLMSHQLYASHDYLERHGQPLTPADLSHHDCLRFPGGEGSSSYWILHSGDRVERVAVFGRLIANNVGMLGRLAARGMGIVPLPVFHAMEKAIAQVGLVRVLPDWNLTPMPLFALLPSRTIPAKTRAFLDFIQPRLQERR